MSTPKISLFLQDLYGGGAERVMLQLATGMAGRGHAVELVLIRPEGPYLDLVPPSVRLTVLGTRRMLNSIAALARHLRRERPDALLTALPHVNVGAVLAAAMARVGTRVVVTEHSQITRNLAGQRQRTVRAAIRMVPWIYPRADRIVAVSGGVADSLAQFSGLSRERIDVVHNGIVTPDLHRLAAEPPGHPWLGDGGPPVLLGVGRLTAVKDFPNLLKAFARVRAERPVRLLILGEGEERGALERMAADLDIAEHVALPGFLSNPYAAMTAAALFVQSSQSEGLPTVLVEAMACGTPVAATGCPGGTRDILEDGRLGPIAPVGDPDALAGAIREALDHPVAAADLKRKAAEFTLDRAVDSYLDLMLGPGND